MHVLRIHNIYIHIYRHVCLYMKQTYIHRNAYLPEYNLTMHGSTEGYPPSIENLSLSLFFFICLYVYLSLFLFISIFSHSLSVFKQTLFNQHVIQVRSQNITFTLCVKVFSKPERKKENVHLISLVLMQSEDQYMVIDNQSDHFSQGKLTI